MATVDDAKRAVQELVDYLQGHWDFGMDFPLVAKIKTDIGASQVQFGLQHNLYDRGDISVDEVVKAGSLGHGTAVPGNFDLDLVLYSRSISADQVAASGYKQWLGTLNQLLQSAPPGKVQSLKQTAYLVQFKYDGMIDVDLLVSPFWDSCQQLYEYLRTVNPQDRYSFSVNASKWQVRFFREQPNQVKEFIKRAKAWRNGEWPKEAGGSGRPKSYMLSLLVLSAYEKASRQVGTSNTGRIATQTTEELKEVVKNHHKLDVYWEKHYQMRGFSDLVPSCPRIIDPANPTNNLYKTGITRYQPNDRSHDYEPGDGNWTQFVRNIDSLDLTKTVEEIQETYSTSACTLF